MSPGDKQTEPTVARAPSGLLLPRVIGALGLRAATFDEVARDPRGGLQGGLLILIIGVLEASVHSAVHHRADVDATLLFEGVFAALIGWFLWSAIVWVVGARSFGHDIAFSEVVRGIAFAHAPGLFYGLGVIPGVTQWSGLLYALTLLWFGAAAVTATQGVFRVPLRRAGEIFGVALLVQLLLREVLPYALRIIPGL